MSIEKRAGRSKNSPRAAMWYAIKTHNNVYAWLPLFLVDSKFLLLHLRCQTIIPRATLVSCCLAVGFVPCSKLHELTIKTLIDVPNQKSCRIENQHLHICDCYLSKLAASVVHVSRVALRVMRVESTTRSWALHMQQATPE